MTQDILLLTKDSEWCDHAGRVASLVFGTRIRHVHGKVGDALPAEDGAPRYAVLLSFLSPWIVPAALLDRTGLAVNFHPAPREYPGIGCYNFALYDGAAEYGVVCHHMAAKVDTGTIIRETRFPVMPEESVESLKYRSMIAMLALFHDIVSLIAAGDALPVAKLGWTRKPFTRAQLRELARVTPDMRPDEIARRVRAMRYPGFPGAEIEAGGVVFHALSPAREPLA